MSLVVVEDVALGFGGRTLFSDLNVRIDSGERVGVVGRNGSGKSSLLYLLGLLDTPTVGEVLFDGRPTQELDKDARAEIRLAGIGFVFQFHFLLPEFTLLGNVMIPMRRLGRWARPEMEQRAAAILDSLGLAEFGHVGLHVDASCSQRCRSATRGCDREAELPEDFRRDDPDCLVAVGQRHEYRA